MKRHSLIAIIACMISLAGTTASAREGLYLGLFYPTVSWSGDIHGLDSGAGYGARLGLGLGRYLALEGSLSRTDHDAGINPSRDFRSSTGDLLVLFPLSGSNAEPYLRGGIGKYELKSTLTTYKGDGNQYGVGLNYYLFPELSLALGYTRSRITFDEGTGVLSLKAVARTIDVGITYHFY